MQAAVKAGRFVWKAPIGYVNHKGGAGSTIKVDPERAPLMRKQCSSFRLIGTQFKATAPAIFVPLVK
jgi:hypothetical protein